MRELVLVPLSDAFLQVGVFVAVLAALVAWTRVRFGESALDVLVRHPRLAPVLGAACGVVPGCGGAILVAGLYLKRRASYGAAVAALTATMGDAAFVLIALDPLLALQVHAVLLLAGVVTGYAVDAVGMDPRARREDVALVAASPSAVATLEAPSLTAGCAPAFLRTAYTTPVDRSLVRQGGLRARLTGGQPVVAGLGPAATLLWVVTVLASLVVVPTTLTLLEPGELAPRFAGVDPALVLGLVGTAACVLVFFRAGCRLSDDGDDVPTDLGSALRHGAIETAFVVVWVAVALVAVELLSALSVLDSSQLVLVGVTGVLIGVGVAVLPGCGVQIAFTGLYAAGALPLPALLANAVAQDGDALLPMLAQDRRAAITTTLLTSVPAVLVGLAALLVL